MDYAVLPALELRHCEARKVELGVRGRKEKSQLAGLSGLVINRALRAASAFLGVEDKGTWAGSAARQQ